MDSRAKSKSDKSLCEKSMKIVTSIIRISSFSIAEKTLGATGKASKEVLIPESQMVPPEKEPLVPQLSGSRRSQEPQHRANLTYVIKPVGRNERTSSHVFQNEKLQLRPKKEDCVDGLASDYIKKIRNQIGYDL